MDQFHSFSKLPEAIRLQIWTHVANFPRVVGTRESHDYKVALTPTNLETQVQLLPLTHAISTTRAPAILGVCREARTLALTIYNTIFEDIRTKDSRLDRPIYVNPAVDIIYRGKAACRKGDAFRVRCRDWEEESDPLCGTRILAVDTIALRALKKPELNTLPIYDQRRWEGLQKKVQERLRKPSDTSPAAEIARCALKGVREVMVVVGNDDDLSEVTLIPFDKHLGERSAREQKAFLEVCSLRRSVDRYWTGHVQPTNPEFRRVPGPTITLMTVKRAPLKYFSRFSDLPVEIQHMIWKFAYKKPRMFTLAHSQSKNELYVSNCRQPAMVHACRAARTLAMKGSVFTLEHAHCFNFYKPYFDTIRLFFGRTQPRTFSGVCMPSIGLSYHSWALGEFSAADAKLIPLLKEIVLLVGYPVAGCEVELIPIPDEDEDVVTDQWYKCCVDFEIYEAFKFARCLEKDMEKISKKWKTYQRSRVKKGKSSPDWNVPKVRVAYVKNITLTVSPYSY
jgi:hypothetical protein